jgi:protein involved in ribonucleotide reduction
MANYIELKLKETVLNDKLHWDEKYVLVCAHQGTGGTKSYVKKKPKQVGRFQQNG